MKKSLLFVTGTRADFGKIEPLAIAAKNAGHKVTFWVTGMHMMERYGLTKLEVQRSEGVDIVEFENQSLGDPQDLVLANTITGFSTFVREMKPDLVIIHGDRIEAIACALVCATNYIRCAHIEGGEVSGTIDELFRHCNTKLAHSHFLSSQTAAKRVAALGEADERIFVIGSPELDFHSQDSGVSIEDVRAYYEIPFADYGICTFHPVTSEQETIGAQADALFSAMADSGRNFVVILPNNDPGAESILSAIERMPKERFRVLPSMRFAHFSQLMKDAGAILGNSSAGVREAPFLGVPSLDIGTRQNNRAAGESITACSAFDRTAIDDFLTNTWGKRYPASREFGSGSAADCFVEILQDQAFWNLGFQKEFRDLD